MKMKYDTSTIRGRIKVMEHFAETHEQPLCRHFLNKTQIWDKAEHPRWNWLEWDYNYPAEPEPPKLVPWTFETCPKTGALYTTKDGKKDYRVPFGFSEDGLEFFKASDVAEWNYLLEYCLHSVDGGRTWRPCGTEEKR